MHNALSALGWLASSCSNSTCGLCIFIPALMRCATLPCSLLHSLVQLPCARSPCTRTLQEVKQGLWLCYIAAGCVGILPPFFGRKPGSKHWRIIDHDVSHAADLPFVIKLLVVFVPILQVIAALAVLATGGVLYLFEANQTDLVQIIINSVALAFILDIDNRFGSILSLRGGRSQPTAFRPSLAVMQMLDPLVLTTA